MRPALVIVSFVVASMAAASRPAGQTTVDPRPLQEKIHDFLTMRLTREAIENNIFDPIKFAISQFTGEDKLVGALRGPVLASRVGYDVLWARLSSPPRPGSKDRKEWARKAAEEAAKVNTSLQKFADAVLALDAKTHKVMDPSLERSFALYVGIPVRVGDFETFLNNASEQNLADIASEIQTGREIVTRAHDCFLCFIAKRQKTAQPAGVNCAACSR